jgi:hypothetical protein
MELAIINGTYRDSSSKNSSREYPPPLLPPALPPPPRVETKMHFLFSALLYLDKPVNQLYRFPLKNLGTSFRFDSANRRFVTKNPALTPFTLTPTGNLFRSVGDP